MVYTGVVPLTFKLDPYQQKYIDDSDQLVLVRKSRRIGMSWAAAYKAITHSFKHRVNIFYMGYDTKMTATFIKDCADIAEALEAISKKKLLMDRHGATTYKLRLTNGCEISALSSKPENVRSKGRANELLIIDEAAHHDDLRTIIKAATPMMAMGVYIHIISTEYGSQNTFHKLYNEILTGKRMGSVHTITLKDALKQGYFKRLCRDNPDHWDNWKVYPGKWSLKKQKAFQKWMESEVDDADQELYCIPTADMIGSFLSWTDIEKAKHKDAGLRSKFKNGPACLGIDVASERNDFVITASEKVNDDVVWVREVKILSPRKKNIKINLDTVLPIITDMARFYNVDKIVVDASGHGEWFGKNMIDEFGKSMVELIKFNQHNKYTIATEMKNYFETQKMRIPDEESGIEEWEYIIDDLKSMNLVYNESGPRLKAKSKVNHNDIFISMMLSVYMVGTQQVYMKSVPRKRGVFGKSELMKGFLGQS